jgi:hypothetical protein
VIHVYSNYALSIARQIVIEKNLKVFLQVRSFMYLSVQDIAILFLKKSFFARGWNLCVMHMWFCSLFLVCG